MLLRDYKNRIFKTGLKIDYTPKLINFNSELLPSDKIHLIACGRRHYVIHDVDNNLHILGKVVSSKSIGMHDGFEVYDADQLFDGCKIKQLSMQYEIFGAVVEEK